jgi:hypothetical protein
VRDLVFDLLLVRLRYLVVLAVDAAQITVAEKYVARAVCANKSGLFAEVRRVGRGDLFAQTVIEAIARADRAAFEQRFERPDAPLKLARRV